MQHPLCKFCLQRGFVTAAKPCCYGVAAQGDFVLRFVPQLQGEGRARGLR
jgi:hypothetical protein